MKTTLTLALCALALCSHAQEKTVKAYQSIASLRYIDPNIEDNTVACEGLLASGDGGGGMLRYYPTSATATNAATVFKPVNFNGRWIMVFGGPGTSVPLTFASITNALNYFPLTNTLAAITNALGFDGDPTKFLNGAGELSVPAGGGGGGNTLWATNSDGFLYATNFSNSVFINGDPSFVAPVGGSHFNLVGLGYGALNSLVAEGSHDLLALGTSAATNLNLNGSSPTVAIGFKALANATLSIADSVVVIGPRAGQGASFSNENNYLLLGSDAGNGLVSSNSETFFALGGTAAMQSHLTDSPHNFAIGEEAFNSASMTGGSQGNSFYGFKSGESSALNNSSRFTFIGPFSGFGFSDDSGTDSDYIGSQAGRSATSINGSTAIQMHGDGAAQNAIFDNVNSATGIGYRAFYNAALTNSTYNYGIGNQVNFGLTGSFVNTFAIGHNISVSASHDFLIGNAQNNYRFPGATFSTLGGNGNGPDSISVTASPFTYTAPSKGNVHVYIDGGTGTAITINGTQVFSSLTDGHTVDLQPNETVTVTYSVAPTMHVKLF